MILKGTCSDIGICGAPSFTGGIWIRVGVWTVPLTEIGFMGPAGLESISQNYRAILEKFEEMSPNNQWRMLRWLGTRHFRNVEVMCSWLRGSSWPRWKGTLTPSVQSGKKIEFPWKFSQNEEQTYRTVLRKQSGQYYICAETKAFNGSHGPNSTECGLFVQG